MKTKLLLHKWVDGKHVAQASVMVPCCPMFDFDRQNNTPELQALLDDGFKVSGHIDMTDEETV